jgi:heme-degrading monooxygenase HmoA
LLIRDVDDGDTGGTLSFWDSADAARAYEEGELRAAVLPQLSEFFAGEFISHVCEARVALGNVPSGGDIL